jgi:hypothetical protein
LEKLLTTINRKGAKMPDKQINELRAIYDSFEELNACLKNLPVTWYPVLIKTMVNTAYEKNVFKPNMASVFIKQNCEEV